MKDIVVFDLETTGFSPDFNHIIEIGAVRYGSNGREIGRFSVLVNPHTHIPQAVTDVTHISDNDVRFALDEKKATQALVDFAEGADILGHGVSFDVKFCRARIPTAFDGAMIYDTESIAKRLVTPVETMTLPVLTASLITKNHLPDGTYTFDELVSKLIATKEIPQNTYTLPSLATYCLENKLVQNGKYTLGTLAILLDVRHSHPHRAWSDAQATYGIFRKLLGRATGLSTVDLDAQINSPAVQQNASLVSFFTDVVNGNKSHNFKGSATPGAHRSDLVTGEASGSSESDLPEAGRMLYRPSPRSARRLGILRLRLGAHSRPPFRPFHSTHRAQQPALELG